MKASFFFLPGILFIIRVAVVRTFSTPGGLLGLEMAKNFDEFSISVNCLTFACSSLNSTCSVILFHTRTLPDSVDMIYLKIKLSYCFFYLHTY